MNIEWPSAKSEGAAIAEVEQVRKELNRLVAEGVLAHEGIPAELAQLWLH